MNIVVLACASRVSGALTIYKQFLSHLPKYTTGNRYYIFVDPSMPQPPIEGVEYIHESDHSWRRRIWFNRKGVQAWANKVGVVTDLIFSLQNTGIVTDCRQVIYYHQSLPFYPNKWNPFKRLERTMFLYKHIYPWFVKNTLNDNTEVVVQIPFIKRGFARLFHYDENKVHTLFPDVEEIDAEKIVPYNYEEGTLNFVYPAIPAPYKNHSTLIKSVSLLKHSNPSLASKIRFHLTVTKEQASDLWEMVKKAGVEKQFVFCGKVSHELLLSMYKASIGFCFPSTIETLGLPLLEASNFGLPVIAADMEYAHEVIGEYEGVRFADATDCKAWAGEIERICETRQKFNRLKHRDSTWPKCFEIMLNKKESLL